MARSLRLGYAPHRRTLSRRILGILAGFLILKVTSSVVSNYHDYFPPNFASDFLRGRERHFLGAYRWAFYTHIMSGPVSLILGLILIGERSRSRFPKWHRYLGRVQVACVLLLVTPSGLWMAYYAAAGPHRGDRVGGTGDGYRDLRLARRKVGGNATVCGPSSLDVAMLSLVMLGRRAQVDGRTGDGQGVAAPWVDSLATWMSWLVPLAAFELRERTGRKPGSRRDWPRPSNTRRRDPSVR